MTRVIIVLMEAYLTIEESIAALVPAARTGEAGRALIDVQAHILHRLGEQIARPHERP